MLLLATHIFSLLPAALKTQMFNTAYQGQVVNFSILISTCHSSLSSQSFFFLFFKHNKLFLIWELMHFLIASLGTVVLTSNHPSIHLFILSFNKYLFSLYVPDTGSSAVNKAYLSSSLYSGVFQSSAVQQNFLQPWRYFRLAFNTVATSCMWPLSTWHTVHWRDCSFTCILTEALETYSGVSNYVQSWDQTWLF